MGLDAVMGNDEVDRHELVPEQRHRKGRCFGGSLDLRVGEKLCTFGQVRQDAAIGFGSKVDVLADQFLDRALVCGRGHHLHEVFFEVCPALRDNFTSAGEGLGFCLTWVICS